MIRRILLLILLAPDAFVATSKRPSPRHSTWYWLGRWSYIETGIAMIGRVLRIGDMELLWRAPNERYEEWRAFSTRISRTFLCSSFSAAMSGNEGTIHIVRCLRGPSEENRR